MDFNGGNICSTIIKTSSNKSVSIEAMINLVKICVNLYEDNKSNLLRLGLMKLVYPVLFTFGTFGNVLSLMLITKTYKDVVAECYKKNL